MKARLEELQKVYADLKREYDECVETLTAVNQAWNKYYEDNYFLLGKLRELKEEIKSLQDQLTNEKKETDKIRWSHTILQNDYDITHQQLNQL